LKKGDILKDLVVSNKNEENFLGFENRFLIYLIDEEKKIFRVAEFSLEKYFFF
jgi:hypothetical protein